MSFVFLVFSRHKHTLEEKLTIANAPLFYFFRAVKFFSDPGPGILVHFYIAAETVMSLQKQFTQCDVEN